MVSVGMSDRVVRPSNAEIAAAFREAAGLLRIQGAKPFRVAAYERAADTINKLPQDISEVAAEGIEALENLPHIGSGLASAILELVRTGRWTQLERLRGAADPEALFQIIPGIGPGLARRIHEHLDFETLEALEVAAHEGRLAAVPGVGPRRAKAILLALSALLNRRRPVTTGRALENGRPPVGLLLDVDREYRHKAEAGVLQLIAPRRFNLEANAWLPILHTGRGPGRKLAAEQQNAFIAAYENLLNGLGEDEAVMFVDAVHPTHVARPVGCWAPSTEHLAIEQTSGRQRLNVHGAVNLETGETRMIDVETVNAASTIRLLLAIAAMYPLMTLIHVFLDNARYHHAVLVQDWLAQPGRRIRLHYVPAYCPHLNPIERLWGVMHRYMTHNRCHSKYREFAEEVLEFLRETVPVRWSEFRDSVTDNFRVIDPRDFRVLK